ncbi:hypothetical protein SESBI_36354 [Sesbania bispinosa]|nr:hypothetical protein SESBI_36354 [Sesbania bispinosa]
MKPSAELSPEEQDLLDRSTKKPKIVVETSNKDGEVPLVEVEMAKESESDKSEEMEENTELFETVSGVATRRNSISYKDALGVNGGDQTEFDCD